MYDKNSLGAAMLVRGIDALVAGFGIVRLYGFHAHRLGRSFDFGAHHLRNELCKC